MEFHESTHHHSLFGEKARSGYHDEGSRLTNDLLPDTARQLLVARGQLRDQAKVDESTLLPAWMRYTGLLYESARESLASAIDHGEHILIISGGYGVVKVEEPIGWYEAILNLAWWPRGLLERCILEYVRQHQLQDVVCFAGSKTPYARLLRRIPWQHSGLAGSRLLSPDLGGEGGAMKKSPEAQGEALRDYFSIGLAGGWKSSKGFRLAEEVFV
jgi:hypothetical protein